MAEYNGYNGSLCLHTSHCTAANTELLRGKTLAWPRHQPSPGQAPPAELDSALWAQASSTHSLTAPAAGTSRLDQWEAGGGGGCLTTGEHHWSADLDSEAVTLSVLLWRYWQYRHRGETRPRCRGHWHRWDRTLRRHTFLLKSDLQTITKVSHYVLFRAISTNSLRPYDFMKFE